MNRRFSERCHLRLFLTFAIALTMVVSCKKVGQVSSDHIKKLTDVAAQLNKSCPKDEPNGTRLESVSLEENTMAFRLSLSDQALTSIDASSAKDSIIANLSDKLKTYLIKGNCDLSYKYVSPNDSTTITITPKELEEIVSTDKK